MRKKFTMLLALVLCAFTSSVMAQTFYTPGERTTTLEAGKKYFISVATYYSSACTNLLYNNGGTLAKSDKLPNAVVSDATFLFTIAKVGDNDTYYITNSDGKYLQSGDLTSTETETAITVVPYNRVKGSVTCGNDVQACDENGNQIAYDDITDETAIVCVYESETKGWRYINTLQTGKSTPFAFYEAVEKNDPFEVTTDENSPIYYTIKNVRGNAYASYAGAETYMELSTSFTNPTQLFYFTKGSSEGTYKIHNYASSKLCAEVNSWTTEGIDWYITPSGTGLAIAKEATLTDTGSEAWNDYQNTHTSVNLYGGKDAGSIWSIEKYEGEVPGIQLSTEDEIVLHHIRSIRRNSYVNFEQHNATFKEGALGAGSYWYFMQDEEEQENAPEGFIACRIFNAAHATAVENFGSGFMGTEQWPAKVFYIGLRESVKGTISYVIRLKDDADNGWHDYSGTHIGSYGLQDEGSYWRIYKAAKTPENLKNEAATAKADALAFIANAEAAYYYTYSDEAIATAKSAVEGVNTDVLSSAVTELLHPTIETVLTTLKASERGTTVPAAGEYIQLKNRQYGTYLNAGASALNGVNDKKGLSTLWLVEAGDGANVKLKNASTGKYIGEIRNSAQVSMVEEANAKQFAWTNQADVYAVFKETTGGDYAYGHINGSNVLVGWLPSANATQWVVSREVVTLPEAGKYYFIECPLFYGVQGVKKALYSDGTNPRWKTLDVADKSFYWTVEQTGNGYVLKNANDNKYVLGKAANQTSWTMEAETTGAEYTLELAGEGQVFIKIADRHLHANNHGSGNGGGSDIVSWETNEANTASAWAFVTTDNPEWGVAKSTLQERVNELQQVVGNATDKIGYYKSAEAAKLVEPIATAQSVLDGGSTEAKTYTDALTNLNTAVEGVDMNVILPVEGKFYRIMNNDGTGYLSTGTGTGRTQFVAGIGEKASSIFYYTGEKLVDYTTGLYLVKDNENMLAYTNTVGEAAGTIISFAKSPVLGKLLISFDNGNRSFYSNAVGESNAASSGQTGESYRFTVSEVEWLPVAMNAAVGYATLYSPVELGFYGRVKAYTGTVNGDWLTLTEQTAVPANKGVVLELIEDAAVEDGYVFLPVQATALDVESDLVGHTEAVATTGTPYTLQQNGESVVFRKYTGANLSGFKAYLNLPTEAAAIGIRFEDGTTAIDNVQLSTDNVVIYDLAGRRVEKMEKGIYIVNGKKVIR